jgi:nucleosome assembly protein 1-like 1
VVHRRVEALQDIQSKHGEIETQFRKERAALELKYEQLYGSCIFIESHPERGAAELT